MSRIASRVWLFVCLAGLSSAGCALHRPTSFRDRLIAGGKPSKEIGPPKVAAKRESFEAYVARVKQLSAAARPERTGIQLSAESQSPELAAALFKLRTEPSAANERAAGEAYRAAGLLGLA